jgi:hypothetical protein
MVMVAVVVPTTLAISGGMRPAPVVATALPTAARSLDALPELGAWPDLFGPVPLTVRLVGSGVGPLIEVRAVGDLAVPEPLIYLSGAAATSGPLPDDARLLGVLDDRGEVRGALTGQSDLPARTVWLYSLGRSEVIAVASLPEPQR